MPPIVIDWEYASETLAAGAKALAAEACAAVTTAMATVEAPTALTVCRLPAATPHDCNGVRRLRDSERFPRTPHARVRRPRPHPCR
eukprot:2605636-Prymnesium_polylepis.1